jgi:hypothetical protein
VHGTRKTCGSLLAALDVHPRVAMQTLRHSKIAVTMEIYTEVPSAATRSAQEVRSVAGRLARCCTSVLYGQRKRPVTRSQLAAELGGRYWDRTSDLLGVNEALSR